MADQPTPPFDAAQTHIVAQWKHGSPLVSCRVEPKGRFALAGAQDRSVVRWNMADGAATTLSGHESWVRSIAFSPDGETTYTGGYEGRLISWPTAAEKPAPARTIDAHAGWVRGVAVSPDGSLIATCGNDQLVKLWNAADGKLLQTLSGHERHVYSVLFHSGGQLLLSGDLMGKVHQWEIASGKLLRSFDAKELYTPNEGQAAEYGGVRSMALSPDGKHLACGGLHKGSNPFGAVQDPLVLVFEWESQKKVQSHLGAGDLKGIAWRVAYQAGGVLVGASGGSGGGHLLFWKLDQANEFHRFALPNTALDMDLHPDGLRAVTAHHDGHLRVVRMAAKAA